jgi:hypothetical protein
VVFGNLLTLGYLNLNLRTYGNLCVPLGSLFKGKLTLFLTLGCIDFKDYFILSQFWIFLGNSEYFKAKFGYF